MLIKFTSNVSGSILMLDEHALPVLKAAGKVFEDNKLSERGVFTAPQLPEAVAKLKKAIDDAPPLNDEVNEDMPDSDKKMHTMNQPVSFKQRAYPLYEMLVQAEAAGDDVMWEPTRTAWD